MNLAVVNEAVTGMNGVEHEFTAEDQAAERSQTDFDQDHARNPATDREPASGLADRG
jgi:hypothetical protein